MQSALLWTLTYVLVRPVATLLLVLAVFVAIGAAIRFYEREVSAETKEELRQKFRFLLETAAPVLNREDGHAVLGARQGGVTPVKPSHQRERSHVSDILVIHAGKAGRKGERPPIANLLQVGRPRSGSAPLPGEIPKRVGSISTPGLVDAVPWSGKPEPGVYTSPPPPFVQSFSATTRPRTLTGFILIGAGFLVLVVGGVVTGLAPWGVVIALDMVQGLFLRRGLSSLALHILPLPTLGLGWGLPVPDLPLVALKWVVPPSWPQWEAVAVVLLACTWACTVRRKGERRRGARHAAVTRVNVGMQGGAKDTPSTDRPTIASPATTGGEPSVGTCAVTTPLLSSVDRVTLGTHPHSSCSLSDIVGIQSPEQGEGGGLCTTRPVDGAPLSRRARARASLLASIAATAGLDVGSPQLRATRASLGLA